MTKKDVWQNGKMAKWQSGKRERNLRLIGICHLWLIGICNPDLLRKDLLIRGQGSGTL
ncbi:MAG TPA: hypothetical protein VFG54_20140 [Prolixibacteraceae bacterium]|nr:hypothetical protein [Prolixibacteraceae bacterium]